VKFIYIFKKAVLIAIHLKYSQYSITKSPKSSEDCICLVGNITRVPQVFLPNFTLTFIDLGILQRRLNIVVIFL